MTGFVRIYKLPKKVEKLCKALGEFSPKVKYYMAQSEARYRKDADQASLLDGLEKMMRDGPHEIGSVDQVRLIVTENKKYPWYVSIIRRVLRKYPEQIIVEGGTQ